MDTCVNFENSPIRNIDITATQHNMLWKMRPYPRAGHGKQDRPFRAVLIVRFRLTYGWCRRRFRGLGFSALKPPVHAGPQFPHVRLKAWNIRLLGSPNGPFDIIGHPVKMNRKFSCPHLTQAALQHNIRRLGNIERIAHAAAIDQRAAMKMLQISIMNIPVYDHIR